MRANVVAVLAATATVALTAWGQTSTPPESVATTSAAPPASGQGYAGTICRGDTVAADLSLSARRKLDPAFSPVTVVGCSADVERIPGQGEWRVLVEERASSGITALVTAMRQPDTTPIAGQMCTMQLDPDPEVWFLDATGHAVLPAWPRNGCHHIASPARKALDALHWTTVARVRIAQVTPQEALDAGCETAWKYMFDVSAGNETSRKPGDFADLAASTDPHLCVYQRATDDPLRGDFVSGRAVSPTAWTDIRTALNGTPPAESCSQTATRFAVLKAGPYVEIELDGCRRVLTPDDGLRLTTPELTALLA